jgi:hypothetical protein
MRKLISALKTDWSIRPWWMSLLFYFCVYMTFLYLPFDLFLKPIAEDHEIWFGFAVTGWWAKATEPVHWLIYGAGTYGFWRMRSWMWPWAAAYGAQVTIAMLVWNIINLNGGGWTAGLIAAAVFAVVTIALWRAKEQFANTIPAPGRINGEQPH